MGKLKLLPLKFSKELLHKRCMTSDTVKTLQSLKIISSGMTRRCLFVMGDLAEKPIAFPDVTDAQRDAFKAMIAHGIKVQNTSGEFVWQQSARDHYTMLYNKISVRV